MAGAAGGYLLVRRRLNRLATMSDDYRAYWLRRARRPGQLRYVALGDSLSQGVSAGRPARGFVGLLADRLAEATGRSVAVLNWSASGATVADVLAHQLPRLAALPGPAPDLVTVCVGSNDVTRTDLDEFRAAFRTLCAALPARTLVADLPHFRRGPHVAAAARYARACREVVAEFPALVPVPLEEATGMLGVCELGLDLVHPGAAGHRRYADVFTAALAGTSRFPALSANRTG